MFETLCHVFLKFELEIYNYIIYFDDTLINFIHAPNTITTNIQDTQLHSL